MKTIELTVEKRSTRGKNEARRDAGREKDPRRRVRRGEGNRSRSPSIRGRCRTRSGGSGRERHLPAQAPGLRPEPSRDDQGVSAGPGLPRVRSTSISSASSWTRRSAWAFRSRSSASRAASRWTPESSTSSPARSRSSACRETSPTHLPVDVIGSRHRRRAARLGDPGARGRRRSWRTRRGSSSTSPTRPRKWSPLRRPRPSRREAAEPEVLRKGKAVTEEEGERRQKEKKEK